jgi:hypothetical protein
MDNDKFPDLLFFAGVKTGFFILLFVGVFLLFSFNLFIGVDEFGIIFCSFVDPT